MNFNFNRFEITDDNSARALQRYLRSSSRDRFLAWGIAAGVIYILGKTCVEQEKEIKKLRRELVKSKKGD